jgi:hypothetical protein
MKIDYIKTKDRIYKSQEKGVRDESKIYGNYPVCNIKKISFGRYKIDYFCSIRQCYVLKKGIKDGDEDTPNTRVILYPNGIEEIWFK